MTRRARVSKLEGQKVRRADPVRVVITRRIIEGGATVGGEDWQARPCQIVRREFDLYPEGLPSAKRGRA